MLGWLSGILAVWGEELRAVAEGRRHLLRRVVVVGTLQALGLRLLGHLVPGFAVADWRSAFVTVATIAALNAGLWPVLVYLTLPLTVLTFGLFTLVLNAGLLLVAAALVPGLSVAGFGAAVWSGIGLAVINAIVSSLLEVSEDETFYRNVLGRAARRRGATAGKVTAPGLVIVQIDGLGVDVLRFALRSGLMPTLARWVRAASHRVRSWECGLPSQTSASQAGILYGDNFDIPAFRWYEKDSQRLIVSNRPADAAAIDRRVSNGHGLLGPNGTSLSTLLSGEAGRSVLTLGAPGSGARQTLVRSSDFLSYFLDPYSVSRSMVLMAWEIALELWQGNRQRVRDIQPRVARGGAFPFLRAFSCVLLRDLTTILLVDELYRGVPTIYADYIGYDELAHHTGPESPEALAALGGLDRQIAVLERAVHGAPRPYEIVILSDHGQSSGVPFRQRYGLTLEQLVQSLLAPQAAVCGSIGTHEGWGRLNALVSELVAATGRAARRPLARLLRQRIRDGSVELGPDGSTAGPQPSDVVVCASGNLGLIYFTEQTERSTREDIEAAHPRLIGGLLEHPGVGFVLVRSAGHGAVVLGRDGMRELAGDRVEGRDPLVDFGPLAADHLRRLDSFPHVGDLVVNSRLEPGTKEVAAFEELVGSHGGLGGAQTSPFLLVPTEWEIGRPDLVGAPAIHAVLRSRLDRSDGRQPCSSRPESPASVAASHSP